MPEALLRLPAGQTRPVIRLLAPGQRGVRTPATETTAPTAHATAIDATVDEACSRLGLSLTNAQRTWVHAAVSGHPATAPHRAKVGWATTHRVALEVLANPNAHRNGACVAVRHSELRLPMSSSVAR